MGMFPYLRYNVAQKTCALSKMCKLVALYHFPLGFQSVTSLESNLSRAATRQNTTKAALLHRTHKTQLHCCPVSLNCDIPVTDHKHTNGVVAPGSEIAYGYSKYTPL